MRFFYENKFDSGTLTETTQNAEYPVENLHDTQRSKVWKTLGTQAAESVIVNLGAAYEVNCIIVLDHDLTTSDSAIKIQGDDEASFTSPPVDETITHASGNLFKKFRGGNYQYWKFSFTKSAAGQIRSMGRIFLGTHYNTEKGIDLNGLKYNKRDLSTSSKTIGGQTYSYQKSRFYAPSVTFTNIPMAMMDNIEAVGDACGTHTPFFVMLDTDPGFSDILYVKFTDLPDRDFSLPSGDTMIFRTQLKLEELL